MATRGVSKCGTLGISRASKTCGDDSRCPFQGLPELAIVPRKVHKLKPNPYSLNLFGLRTSVLSISDCSLVRGCLCKSSHCIAENSQLPLLIRVRVYLVLGPLDACHRKLFVSWGGLRSLRKNTLEIEIALTFLCIWTSTGYARLKGTPPTHRTPNCDSNKPATGSILGDGWPT